jgi:hypothetical protein
VSQDEEPVAGGAAPKEITNAELEKLRQALQPLIDVQVGVLRLPKDTLVGFEPSQIGTLVGVIMDACIPQLDLVIEGDQQLLQKVGLKKHAGILKDREGYPDYIHDSGVRAELKLLYVDPEVVKMKKPSTPREPSARLTQKVTIKNVRAQQDTLLVVAYQLQPEKANPTLYVPTIIDLGVFSMIECIRARDKRLIDGGGRWFGDFETPCVLSKAGRKVRREGGDVDCSSYGRKESEGKHYNEDTNFGKLNRIPYAPLQEFMNKHGLDKGTAGESKLSSLFEGVGK